MFVAMIVVVVVLRGVRFGTLDTSVLALDEPVDDDVYLHRGDTASVHGPRSELDAADPHAPKCVLEGSDFDAEVEERPEQHVAARARETLEVDGFHAPDLRFK